MSRTVAVVGATGAVGRELRRQLETRAFPCDEVVFVASERSAGTVLRFRGREVTVRALSAEDVFAGVDIALFSAGASTARQHAPRAVDAGAVVVDNSSAWRMDPAVPLVVSEINPQALDGLRGGAKGIVANPNCTAMVTLLPLKALHDAYGLAGFASTSFQAAGGAGQKGMDELMAQVPLLLPEPELLAGDGAAARKLVGGYEVHADVLGFNVVPLLGKLGEDGYTDEELKMREESRKILSLPWLRVAPTCVRVPVMVGHSIEVRAEFEQPVGPVAEVTSLLEAFPNLVVDEAPTPLAYAGRDEVAVGRIRRDLDDERALNFFVVGDNLLKGAALNTVQIAEELVARDLA